MTARSATKVALLLSVAWLLPGTGSLAPAGGATVVVFTSAPVVPAGMVPDAENVAVAPGGRFTSTSMAPVPEAVPQLPPADEQVQPKPAAGAGSASWTRAPTALLGPALVTTIV